MRDIEPASRVVLGFCFSKDCSAVYLDALKEMPIDAFYPDHRSIFSAIADLPSFEGGFEDLSAVAAKIQSIGLKINYSILADVALTDTSEQAAVQCIEILTEIYHQYRVSKKLNALSKGCLGIDTSRDLKEWAEKSQKDIVEDLSVFSRADFGDVSESMSEAISGFESEDNDMIRSGFKSIDGLIGGLPKKSLVLVAGRPSMGKTSLAVCQAMRSAYTGSKGLIFSLEMTKSQIGQKMISIASQMAIQYLSKRIDIAVDVARQISSLGIEISDDPDLSVEDIGAIVRQKSGIDFVIIDYLQLMRATPGLQSREREVSHISKTLKQLAKTTGICVIALCQLNRELEKRADTRPKMSDLRESGSLEQDADLVCFVYREAVYDKESDSAEAEFIVAKNRLGPIGTARLRWDASCTRFSDF